jgi:hypothetical protein
LTFKEWGWSSESNQTLLQASNLIENVSQILSTSRLTYDSAVNVTKTTLNERFDDSMNKTKHLIEFYKIKECTSFFSKSFCKLLKQGKGRYFRFLVENGLSKLSEIKMNPNF